MVFAVQYKMYKWEKSLFLAKSDAGAHFINIQSHILVGTV